MSPFPVRMLAGLLAAAQALVAGPAAAEDLLERLVAIRRSLGPAAPEARNPPPARSAPAEALCVRGAWWRDDGHGARLRTAAAIGDASLRFGVDAALIRSVIAEESDGDPLAISHKGAMGLMQLMPGTAEELGVVCPFDPRANVLGGTRYLRALHDRFESWERALAAYHAGPARIERGRIPHETRRYVRRVMNRWRPLVVVWR